MKRRAAGNIVSHKLKKKANNYIIMKDIIFVKGNLIFKSGDSGLSPPS